MDKKITYLVKFVYHFGSSIIGVLIHGFEKYFNNQKNCDKTCHAVMDTGVVMVKLAMDKLHREKYTIFVAFKSC